MSPWAVKGLNTRIVSLKLFASILLRFLCAAFALLVGVFALTAVYNVLVGPPAYEKPPSIEAYEQLCDGNVHAVVCEDAKESTWQCIDETRMSTPEGCGESSASFREFVTRSSEAAARDQVLQEYFLGFSPSEPMEWGLVDRAAAQALLDKHACLVRDAQSVLLNGAPYAGRPEDVLRCFLRACKLAWTHGCLALLSGDMDGVLRDAKALWVGGDAMSFAPHRDGCLLGSIAKEYASMRRLCQAIVRLGERTFV